MPATQESNIGEGYGAAHRAERDSVSETSLEPAGTSTKTVDGLSVLAAAVFLVLVLLSCGYAVFAAGFASAGLTWDPDDIVTLRQWVMGVLRTSQYAMLSIAVGAIGLVLVATLSAFAAWRRNKFWTSVGATGSAMLVGTLILCSTMGLASVDKVAGDTFDRIGPVRLVGPPPGEEHLAESLESDGARPSPVTTRAEAEAEIVRLLRLAAETSAGPILSWDQDTGIKSPFNVAHPQILVESCYADPDGEIGAQLSAVLELPGDETGEGKQRVVDAWESVGYGFTDQIRSQSFLAEADRRLRSVSVNDSSTIDSLVRVRLESWCTSDG